jgi:hypothetical protein
MHLKVCGITITPLRAFREFKSNIPILPMSQSFSTFDTITGGMHHGTLLLACGIIACNRYEGYLSTDAKGEERVEAHNEDVVPNGKYFYQLQDPATGSLSYAYPLHMPFQDWRFPHDDIHVPWANIALSQSGATRATDC